MNSNGMQDPIGVILIAVLVSLIFSAGAYVWMSLAFSKVFTKLGEKGWKAWVPVLNIITVFKLGRVNPLWVIAIYLPVVSVVGVVFAIIALNTINQRFGKGVGFTIFSVLLPPVWATVIGFGSAQPVDGGPAFAAAPAGQAPAVAPRPATPGFAPQSTPPTGFQPGPPAAPLASAPGFITVPPPAPPAPALFAPATPAAPAFSAPAAPATPPPAPAAAPQQSPWAQPINDVPGLSVPTAAPTTASDFVVPTAAPVTSPTASPVAAPAFGDDDEDFDAESTVIVPRRVVPWFFETEQGQKVRLSKTVIFLGRNPSGSADYPDAQLIDVSDSAKTVSKTHARLELIDGAWLVTDLNSTNGVVLLDENGEETELAAETTSTLTPSFLLGELPSRVHQER